MFVLSRVCSTHRGDIDSPISLELVYITALTDFLLELVIFWFGPGVVARISISLPPSIAQRELPLKTAPPNPQLGSPAQREFPQKEGPPSFNQSAPRSGSSLRNSPLPCSIPPKHPSLPQSMNQSAPRSGSSPRNNSCLPQLGSPEQRQLPQEQPLPMLNWAAPRSGSSPHNTPLHPSISSLWHGGPVGSGAGGTGRGSLARTLPLEISIQFCRERVPRGVSAYR